jgi:hypothetical protein
MNDPRPQAGPRTVQAWILPIADDPEAASALAVARSRLAAGRGLETLRRFRLVEIAGTAADADTIARRLHESTQFYNPHKERCRLRTASREGVPAELGETLVLVHERGGDRRPAAERWWRHESGESVEVREGVVWALGFAAGEDAAARAEELTVLRDARHGLLCNPWSQRSAVATGPVAVPWIAEEPA